MAEREGGGLTYEQKWGDPGDKPAIPEDFRYLVEAAHWAKCFLQAAELEETVMLSQATDWFARAMAAAREDAENEGKG
jgi:hypothetical protein